MPVKALGDYEFAARDRQEVFGSDEIVYLYVPNNFWFCSAAAFRVSQEMLFEDLWKNVFFPFIQADATLKDLSWHDGAWDLQNEHFLPTPDQTLKAQGIGHKTMLTWNPYS